MSEQSPGAVPPVVPPVPRYGEYAPVVGQPAPPNDAVRPTDPVPASGYLPPSAPASADGGGRKRRTWDLTLTIVLLAAGFIGMLLGLVFASGIQSPEFREGLAAGGFDVDIDFGVLPQVIIVSHVVLYLVALGVSIPLLVRGRIVVFWIPLTAGAIAALILWGGYLGAFATAINASTLGG